MRISPSRARRRGSILPLTAFCILALLTFIALAVDIGVMCIARNQCQNAADSAAMAGARALTGDVSNNNNYTAANPAALAAGQANKLLSQSVQASQVSVTVGSYSYDSTLSQFVPNYSAKGANDNWSLARATVTYAGSTFFANVFGVSGYNTSAVATAVHRPRDVALVADFSGSMRFDSLLGGPHGGTRTLSMNPESAYPLFGHYSSTASANLGFTTTYQVPSGEIIGQTNTVTTTTDGPPVANDFYGDASAYGTSTAAFTAAPDSYATAPGGTNYLKITNNTGATYATNVQDVVGSTSRNAAWELDGYMAFTPYTTSGLTDYSTVPFAGYTQGPRHWGKSFFTWPPDPRAGPVPAAQVPTFLSDFGFTAAELALATVQGIYQANATPGSKDWGSWANAAALGSYLRTQVLLLTSDPKYQKILRLYNRPVCDWRAQFFYKSDGVTPLDDNSLLWDASGNWQAPRAGLANDYYRINYAAILNWIKNTGPNPFPAQLRSGGVLYYDAIPSSIATSTFPPANQNERFWKEYIDEALGVRQTSGSGSTPVYQVITPYTGYGNDFSWGTTQTSAKPGAGGPSMSYTDNPSRPKTHFWFGPMTLLDFMGNYNLGRFWWPGTTHEAPTWQTKIGMQSAIQDIQHNHPNDNVALIFFSSPKTAYNSSGFYNQVRVPLSRNYQRMENCLWFAPRVIDTPTPEIRPYDNGGADIADVPRANGGTCYAMPLMLAYNQFSGSSGLRTYATSPAPAGQAGGNGRKGAQKLLVFETDGMVNTTALASFTNAGAYNSYYNVRLADGTSSGSNEYPTAVSGNVALGSTQATTILSQICALDTAASPGYSTARKPVLVHCIAFGSLFDSSNNSTYKTNALSLLENMQYTGGKAGGEQATTSTPLASYKIIVGPYATRIANLQTAFGTIMQSGVQVSLIE